MKKLILAVSIALSLSACNFESNKTVSLDAYWSDKDSSISPEKLTKMKSKLENLGGDIKRVLNSSAEMIYEVHLTNGQIAYVSYDLSIIFKGNMYRTSDMVNETELSQKILNAEREVEKVLNPSMAKNIVAKYSLDKSLSLTKAKSETKISKIAPNEVNDFASELLSEKSNVKSPIVSNIPSSSAPRDNDLDELKKKIYANIDKRRKAIEPTNIGLDPNTTTNYVAIKDSPKKELINNASEENKKENKYRTKNNVDVNLFDVQEKYIKYKETIITKIGYDNKGNKLSKENTQAQMVAFTKNIKDKGDDWSILYESTSVENKGEIVVFTDPTCPHCKKFHEKISQITDKGYSVRYLFYPRYLALGLDHPKAQKNLDIIKSIWCADDRKEEAHSIYVENTMAGNTCEFKPKINKLFPATDHYFLGLIAGVTSTPTVILPDGRKVSGFKGVINAIK
jgi:hypothetical protein